LPGLFTCRALKTKFKRESPAFDATNLRKEWAKATKAAKLPDLLIHDLRRSGVRNLRNAKVAESVVLAISGHRTRSVFLRYDIVDFDDAHAAMDALKAVKKGG
jgi:integrase